MALPPPSPVTPNTWYSLTGQSGEVNEGNWGAFDLFFTFDTQSATLNLPQNTAWIIQHVSASFDVRDANTGQSDVIPADDGRWNYWEAWQVENVAGRAGDELGIADE